MVLLISRQICQEITEIITFTFQYGSTYIYNCWSILAFLYSFTFQYGSTYISIYRTKIHYRFIIYIPIWFYLYLLSPVSFKSVGNVFTFQYGSTYIEQYNSFLIAYLRFTFQYGSTYINQCY